MKTLQICKNLLKDSLISVAYKPQMEKFMIYEVLIYVKRVGRRMAVKRAKFRPREACIAEVKFVEPLHARKVVKMPELQ